MIYPNFFGLCRFATRSFRINRISQTKPYTSLRLPVNSRIISLSTAGSLTFDDFFFFFSVIQLIIILGFFFFVSLDFCCVIDELALVNGARQFGYTFHDRCAKSVTVSTAPGVEERYEILNTIEFTDARMRMSVIVRTADSKIKLYCKVTRRQYARLRYRCNAVGVG